MGDAASGSATVVLHSDVQGLNRHPLDSGGSANPGIDEGRWEKFLHTNPQGRLRHAGEPPCRQRPLYTAVDANHDNRSTTPIIDKYGEVCNVIAVTYDQGGRTEGTASLRAGSHLDQRMSLARGKHDGTFLPILLRSTRFRPKKGGHGA
jgi:hypothetical protein